MRWAVAILLWCVPAAKGQPTAVQDIVKAASGHATEWAEKLAAIKPQETRGPVSPLLWEAVRQAGGGKLPVAITAIDEQSLEPLRRQIRAQGGEVTAEFHEIIFARLPAAGVDPLSRSPRLARMRPQDTFHAPNAAAAVPPDPKIAPLLSATLADRLHTKGVTGKGSKVGILEAIDPKTVNQHEAMVEVIVSAMAPDAELFHEEYGNEDEFMTAVDRLVAQGVHIINHSAAWVEQPRNGRGILDQKVNEVTAQHNILWVNAAGNEADIHWSITRNRYTGPFSLAESILNSPALMFTAHQDEVDLTIAWDDWGRSQAYVWPETVLGPFLIRVGDILPMAFGTTNQQDFNKPVIRLHSTRVVKGGVYLLFLYALEWSKPVRIHVDLSDPKVPIDSVKLYCPATSTCHPSAEDSIQSPATAANSLTVGAVDLATAAPASGNYGSLAVYSSQGPTDEPRAKPDVSAYTSISSDFLPRRFGGTSASAPVVAGFAALVDQLLPSWSAANARAWILASADRQPTLPRGPNISGVGIVTGALLLTQPSLKTLSIPTMPSTTPSSASSASSAGVLLDRLRESASGPQTFEVKLALGRSSYRIGDGLKLGYMSSEPAYCSIFHIGGDGRYQLVTSSSDRLEAGSRHVFPQEEGSQIRIVGPPGEEEFLLVCSEDPIDWESAPHVLPKRVAVAVARFTIRE